MKHIARIVFAVLLSAATVSAQQRMDVTVDISAKNTALNLETVALTTPQLKAFIRDNTRTYTNLSGLVAVFYHAASESAPVGVAVTNTGTGRDFFTWDLTMNQTANVGTQFCQIIIYGPDGRLYEGSRGRIVIKPSGGAGPVSITNYYNFTNFYTAGEVDTLLEQLRPNFTNRFTGANTTGMVSSTSADAGQFLKSDGSWEAISAGGGDVYQANSQTFTGSNRFAGPVTMSGSVNASAATLLAVPSPGGSGTVLPLEAINYGWLTNYMTTSGIAGGASGETSFTNRLEWRVGDETIGYVNSNGITMLKGSLQLFYEDLNCNVRAYDGSKTAPSVAFYASTNIGWYRKSYEGDYVWAYADKGNDVLWIRPTGIYMAGTNSIQGEGVFLRVQPQLTDSVILNGGAGTTNYTPRFVGDVLQAVGSELRYYSTGYSVNSWVLAPTTNDIATMIAPYYPRENPSNYVDRLGATQGMADASTVTNLSYPRFNNPSNYTTTAAVGVVFYPRNNPSNYVTAAVTNLLASTGLVGATYYPRNNPSNYVTMTVTNNLASTGLVAGTYYPRSNPSNYLVSTQMFRGAGTTGLITSTVADAAKVLRGDGTWTNYSGGAGSGTSAWGSITGVLTNQVDLTNALAALYPRNNPSNYITSDIQLLSCATGRFNTVMAVNTNSMGGNEVYNGSFTTDTSYWIVSNAVRTTDGRMKIVSATDGGIVQDPAYFVPKTNRVYRLTFFAYLAAASDTVTWALGGRTETLVGPMSNSVYLTIPTTNASALSVMVHAATADAYVDEVWASMANKGDVWAGDKAIAPGGFWIGGDNVTNIVARQFTAYLPGAVSNLGYATTSAVETTYYPRNNPSGYIAAVTGKVSEHSGRATNLTAYGDLSIANGAYIRFWNGGYWNYIRPHAMGDNTLEFILPPFSGQFALTSDIPSIAGLASTSFVDSAYYPRSNPSNYVTAAVTSSVLQAAAISNIAAAAAASGITTNDARAVRLTGALDLSGAPVVLVPAGSITSGLAAASVQAVTSYVASLPSRSLQTLVEAGTGTITGTLTVGPLASTATVSAAAFSIVNPNGSQAILATAVEGHNESAVIRSGADHIFGNEQWGNSTVEGKDTVTLTASGIVANVGYVIDNAGLELSSADLPAKKGKLSPTRLGLGTNAPAYELDVHGNTRATGTNYARKLFVGTGPTNQVMTTRIGVQDGLSITATTNTNESVVTATVSGLPVSNALAWATYYLTTNANAVGGTRALPAVTHTVTNVIEHSITEDYSYAGRVMLDSWSRSAVSSTDVFRVRARVTGLCYDNGRQYVAPSLWLMNGSNDVRELARGAEYAGEPYNYVSNWSWVFSPSQTVTWTESGTTLGIRFAINNPATTPGTDFIKIIGGGDTDTAVDLSRYSEDDAVWAKVATIDAAYYPRANPSNYTTTAEVGAVFYPLSNPSNFVTGSVTNDLASTGLVDEVYYPRSNPSNYVSSDAMAFGEMYRSEATNVITFADTSTWHIVTGWAVADITNFTMSTTGAVVNVPGVYCLDTSLTIQGPASKSVLFALHINGANTTHSQGRRYFSSGDYGMGTISAIETLAEGDVIDLRCRLADGTPASGTMTIPYGNARIWRIK